LPSFARAACSGGEQLEDQDEASEQPPAAVPKDVVQQRASVMFSGNTGEVVASGDGPATSAPSYQLAIDVDEVVEGLPAALFDRNAEHRPCGLLDKLGAKGMLLIDLVGLPLLPWALAEPVGKAMVKLKGKIPEKKKQAKKRRTARAAIRRRRLPPCSAERWSCRCPRRPRSRRRGARSRGPRGSRRLHLHLRHRHRRQSHRRQSHPLSM